MIFPMQFNLSGGDLNGPSEVTFVAKATGICAREYPHTLRGKLDQNTGFIQAQYGDFNCIGIPQLNSYAMAFLCRSGPEHICDVTLVCAEGDCRLAYYPGGSGDKSALSSRLMKKT